MTNGLRQFSLDPRLAAMLSALANTFPSMANTPGVNPFHVARLCEVWEEEGPAEEEALSISRANVITFLLGPALKMTCKRLDIEEPVLPFDARRVVGGYALHEHLLFWTPGDVEAFAAWAVETSRAIAALAGNTDPPLPGSTGNTDPPLPGSNKGTGA